MLLRSPYKNLNSYDKPLWDFNNGGEKKRRKQQENFRSRGWGSSLPGLLTQDPPLSPPSMWAEVFRRTCLQSHFFEIFPFSGQNRVILGGRGGHLIFFLLESSFLCYLGAHAKIWINTTNPYGILTTVSRKNQQEINKKRLITKNSGHLCLCQQPRAAHTLCSDQKINYQK